MMTVALLAMLGVLTIIAVTVGKLRTAMKNDRILSESQDGITLFGSGSFRDHNDGM